MPLLTPLFEITFSDRHTVDRDAGVIRGVKILGRNSRNGRVYSDRALHQAAKLYDGIGVNLNHPDHRETNLERSVEAGFGWLEAVAVKADGVYADLHFLRSHPQAAVIVEAAERNPNRFGLSHNAAGRVARRDGKNVVEAIENVRSVDVVQNPATNSGLFESEDQKMSTRTVKEVFQEHDNRLVLLLEDVPLSNYAGAPVDLPDAAPDDADQQVAAAFKSMIGAVLDDDSLDLAARLARIRDILKAQDKLTGHTDDTTNEVPNDKSAKGPPVAESASDVIGKDPTIRQLLERLERIETEAACRSLLETHNRPCDNMRLKALAGLVTDHDRLQLIQSWPEQTSALPGGHVPRPGVSRPLFESTPLLLPKDAKSLAVALR